jgi:hypothetical protein
MRPRRVDGRLVGAQKQSSRPSIQEACQRTAFITVQS